MEDKTRSMIDGDSIRSLLSKVTARREGGKVTQNRVRREQPFEWVHERLDGVGSSKVGIWEQICWLKKLHKTVSFESAVDCLELERCGAKENLTKQTA